MPLSWNEIRSRSLEFSKRWENETSEDAEAKTFWSEFFSVFGIDRKRVASFEEPVKKLGDRQGFIDLFWKGMLLVEHKSRGKDLDKAYTQALDYFPGIKERDLPKYVLVSDFARFRLYDLEAEPSPPTPLPQAGEGRKNSSPHEVGRGGSVAEGEGRFQEFKLADLHKRIKHFAFIAGYRTQTIAPQNPVNIKAAERMGKLHDALKASGYEGHALEVLLVRLLFCLFAEDTGIFQPASAFRAWIEERTATDGSDLGPQLTQLFQVLNAPENKRSKNLDEQTAAFPYINGKLFAEMLPIADFNMVMREALLDCCALDWSAISPAIFGALFQSIMDAKARRNIGAHYTSEENILKLIQPLFLDKLHAEFQRVKSNKNKLFEFHKKLRTLTFFDPACGCGNFLVIAYRELRKLELDVLRCVHESTGSRFLDVHQEISVDVDQFFGIEIEEFPAQIAQVALWLMDHQMNVRVSEEFGMYFARIPLKTSPHIAHGNALVLDWNDVLPTERCSYVLGNPPFIGAKFMDDAQRADVQHVFAQIKNGGLLDFVAAWYVKAARYMNQLPSPACGGRAGDEGLYSAHAPQKLPEDLKSYAREMRKNQTDAEQLVWHLLRDRQIAGAKFRRQHPIGRYILDFYCVEHQLTVELDGGQHAEQTNYDETRTAFLNAQGIRVLRFWNNEVLQETEAVMEVIWQALQSSPASTQRPSSPALPPPAGEGSKIAAAFVSTNSITQGEQAGVLWSYLLAQGIHIHFAHRTFQWSNEAKGQAAVHCVIIGFYLPSPSGRGAGGEGETQKTIYEYEDIRGAAHAVAARNINPYLVDAPDVMLANRRQPICDVPEIVFGNMPNDGGNLLLSDAEKYELIAKEPAAEKFIRPFMSAKEFINNEARWCLWLIDIAPHELRNLPEISRRVQAVKTLREDSGRPTTRELAAFPTLFGEIRQPTSSYILVPRVSSENRAYIPLGFFDANRIVSDTCLAIPNATLYHFGILTSSMHMAWVRYTCGRLKSDYRYSAGIVYNNFPWPDLQPPRKLSPAGGGRAGDEGCSTIATSHKAPHPQSLSRQREREAIEAAAQAVLDARAQFMSPSPASGRGARGEGERESVANSASLADLYDPLTMPPALVKAHQQLDRAVDASYRKAAFANDAQRVEFLFERYQQLTSLLPTLTTKPKRAKKMSA